MARGALNAVLQYLRRTVLSRESPALTDGQLLDRFLRERDEIVFATLVERHAAKVLTVARRVLRDAEDAEDVFQATFFVLARKAGSIGRRPALAGWLYHVAYHLALKAKAANARRRARERQVKAMRQTAPDTNLDRDDLRTVLDQELSRLPEKYRTPIVLHYLEGKSKNQTAEQLGWTEGTVSGRLARARELLRGRLVRRGYILSATGIATVLADSSAKASVAPLLLSATVDAALAFAQGLTTAGAMSASAASLAEGMVKTMLLAKIKTVAALMLVVSVVAAGASAVGYRTLAGAPGDDTQLQRRAISAPTVLKVPEQDTVRAATAQAGAKDQDQGAEALIILAASGKVVDEKSQPIAGATVYLREIATLRDEAQQPTYTDILAQTATDATGRFTFKDIAARPMHLSPSNTYKHPWNLVVTAAGRGFAWHGFHAREDDNLTIVMRPGARLRGRLLDASGNPAAGVRVQLTLIDSLLERDPKKRVISLESQINLFWSRLPLGSVTNAEGSLLLNGLPPDVTIGLVTSDSRFARNTFVCATLDNADIQRLNATGPAQSKLLGDGFTAQLEPDRSIHGRVVYGDTGKPVAGARLLWGAFPSFTDGQGSYAINGLRSGKYTMFVSGPEGADYLRASAEVVLSPETLERKQDFSLERGSVITGELRRKETGETLRVPYLSIQYESEDGKSRSSGRSKADGTFRIVVPPGKGKLFTWDSPTGRSRLLLGWTEVATPIVIKAGETLTGQHLLIPIPTWTEARGRVLDPDGKPVAGAVFQGATEQAPSAADGSFSLRDLSLDQKSHFLVLSAPRGLGAKLTIDPRKDPKPPAMDVKLVPTRTLSARVVDEKSQPLANVRVDLRLNILISESDNMYTSTTRTVYDPTHTDATGKFTFPNLVVDGSYTMLASAPGRAPAQAHCRVEAGKDPDVADLVLLTNRLVIGGVVVDPGGTPLEGVQVTIMPRNHTLANNHDFMNTQKDGRFHFQGLPKGEYRLLAYLWKKTGALDKDGRPESKREAGTELRVQSGQENIRIILHVPQDPERAARLVGKPAPDFPVARWLNRANAKPEAFKIADNTGRVLLLAFLDEAKPSERLVKTLNALHDKYAAKGLVIVRVYETPAGEAELAQASPTLAALVKPGLVPGRTSEAALTYGVRATPTLFLTDRQGIVCQADAATDELEKRIEELLTR